MTRIIPDMNVCLVERYECISYLAALERQSAIAEQRRRGEAPDTLMTLEHPPTITLGRNATSDEVLTPAQSLAQRGVSIVETDRGGRSTYHGPGQLVVYPILDLRTYGQDLHLYLRNLEEAIILALRRLDMDARRIPGLTGVWVNERKIAAMGIKARGWITSHGCSVNINPDLTVMRSDMVPCGIEDHGVTSIAEEIGNHSVTRSVFEPMLLETLSQVFGFTLQYTAGMGIIST